MKERSNDHFFNFKQNKQLVAHLPLFLQPIELESYLEKHHDLIGRLKLAYSDKISWNNKPHHAKCFVAKRKSGP